MGSDKSAQCFIAVVLALATSCVESVEERRPLQDIPKEKGGDRLDPRCCELRLVTTTGGGFRLESSRGAGFVIGAPDGGRRTVEAGDRLWTLRSSSSRPGFVLETLPEPGREVARTDREDGAVPVGTGIFLEDGRCFWIVPRVDEDRRYELRGWEVDGAYWIAERRGTEWCLSSTPAGAGLCADEIVLLLAAEIVAACGDPAAEPGSLRTERSPE